MQQSILIVDDNPSMVHVIAGMLRSMAQLRFAMRGEDALRMMREQVPDLVLLDAEMPGMTGYQVCEAMQADPLLVDVPVIFVTGHGEADCELRGLEAGAVDFIAKPVNEALLLARVRTQLRLKALSDELRRLATTDGLTGLCNRRQFDELLDREWQRCARVNTPLAMLMADIDHFKRYNDHYGHPAGDECLRQVASALSAVTRRSTDVVARIGGEEFAVLLPGTDLSGASDVAFSLLKGVRALQLPHVASSTAPHVTISVGVTVQVAVPQTSVPVGRLIAAADEALYAAKAQGRDRFHCAY